MDTETLPSAEETSQQSFDDVEIKADYEDAENDDLSQVNTIAPFLITGGPVHCDSGAPQI